MATIVAELSILAFSATIVAGKQSPTSSTQRL